MAKPWQAKVRRHGGMVRLNHPKGLFIDLTTAEAWRAASDYRYHAIQTSRSGADCLNLGGVLPALRGVGLTTDLVLLLAAQLCTCALALDAEWCQQITGSTGEHVHVEITAGEVVRWAGDPSDYPPPSALDLDQMEGD